MSKFYAVTIRSGKIIAEGETYEECSELAHKKIPWSSLAPYYIQDFHPENKPFFHMSHHEGISDGVKFAQSFGRMGRINP